eukprot:TRINITY_DN636_c1_g1_i1.p1 TRINITY_DN636_c1_g1~~TRINITY_DN636_c1_g1_i1.p1  ORF type:complete len:458 (+),score=50.36 TRINITY_DN636_c1_g1_i1:88-1461(+)
MSKPSSGLLSGSDWDDVDLEDRNEYQEKRKKWLRIGLIAGGATVVLIVIVIAAVFGAHHLMRQSDSPSPSPEERRPVILISIDGMRPDYLFRNNGSNTPNLNWLANDGVRAEFMTPRFPSKTFPNHYTIVTGLYPESHGIISNTIFDPVFDATFTISNSAAVTDPRWWWGEPVWVTAILQKLKAAACFWPGSEAPIMNTYPTYWVPYNRNMLYSERVDKVVNWLALPLDERPAFVCVYFEGVDDMGHRYGPDSPQVDAAMTSVDNAIGYLLNRLAGQNQTDVNIIVVSDHGMTSISQNRTILLDKLFNVSELTVVEYGPNAQIIPKDATQAQAIVNSLTGVHPNMSVYMKDLIPAVFQYRDDRRITPVLAVADLGWQITTSALFNSNPSYYNGGTHGFDNRAPDMRASFIAHGPSFKSNFVMPGFDNLHVYELLCHLLQIQPAPNNGTLAAISAVLK